MIRRMDLRIVIYTTTEETSLKLLSLFLFIRNYYQALTFAELDLKVNWRLYRERFLKEQANEES
jgi:hypothetical protein